jgi:S1-C subfamily serine protease/mono/diheme cytochrome c family protein
VSVRRTEVLSAGWGFAVVAGLVLAVGAAHPASTTQESRRGGEELVFLLQYIGVDYGAAVRDGQIVDAREYREMLGFVAEAQGRFAALRPGEPASAPVPAALEDLMRRVRSLAPAGEVRDAATALAARLAAEMDVVTSPDRTPDLGRGRAVYASDCAICHGARGGGDGEAAAQLDPRPTSFRDRRMNLIPPHQVFGAVLNGVPETAMPGWRGARPSDELWDVAFFVMTLREDFSPAPPAAPLPLSLRALSDTSLVDLLDRTGGGAAASSAQIDYLRSHPPSPTAADLHPDGDAVARARARRADGAASGVSASGSGGPSPADPALGSVREIERAFERVAQTNFTSVVGVSSYVPAASSKAPRPGAPGWGAASQNADPYPGYRRARSGSGLLITDDGFLLTCAHLLTVGPKRAAADVVDVELVNNVHCRARIVGLEPTINLAVLKIEAPVPIHAAKIGDSDAVKAGQWAIVLGDPPGVERNFAVGTIAARPERDCYQENRSSTLFQVSMVPNPGSFGGPVVDISGNVIGIVTPRDGLQAAAGDRVYALPADLAMMISDVLREKESRRSPWLGISVLELNEARRKQITKPPLTGVVIEDVFAPSPASRAGVRAGDVLVSLDGNRLFSVPDFQRWLYLLGIGRTVTLEISRDGQILKPKAAIELRPSSIPTR